MCRDRLDKCGSGNLKFWKSEGFFHLLNSALKIYFFRVDASFIFPGPVNLTTQNHKPYPKVDSKLALCTKLWLF